jgi:hypothetical protein
MTTQTPLDDHDLRSALAPLAERDPAPDELVALRRAVAAADHGRPARRTVRTAATVATTTLAVVVGLAVLPGSDQHGRAPRATDVLHAAAASAASETIPPVADGALRYTKVLRTFTYSATKDGRSAQRHFSEQVEAWVGPAWKGRIIASDARRWVTGDAALANLPLAQGGLDAGSTTPYGDGPLANLDPAELPSDPASIARVLEDGIRNNRWSADPAGRGKPSTLPPGVSDASFITYSILNLLTNARLTPAQRSALLTVLADDPNARDLQATTDSRGRAGRGVSLTYDGPQVLLGAQRFRVTFDPRSSEILEWSLSGEPGADARSTPATTTTVLATGFAQRTGERP